MARVFTLDTILEGDELVVNRTCGVSGGGLPPNFTVAIPLTVQFTGCKLGNVLGWATSNRIVDLQRVLRSQQPEFLTQLAKTGLVRHANEMGERIVSPEQRREQLRQTLATMTQAERELLIAELGK